MLLGFVLFVKFLRDCLVDHKYRGETMGIYQCNDVCVDFFGFWFAWFGFSVVYDFLFGALFFFDRLSEHF